MALRTIGGRYRLLERLGNDALGYLWLAEDAELGRRVAVKLLGPGTDHAGFEREARAAAALTHPHIRRLYDFGDSDGEPYVVLEHLPGGSLEERLAAGRPLPDEETARIARELSEALAHAHEQGVVHGNLTPASVLFDADGRAKLAGFGIADIGDGDTSTEALGPAAYLAPEQAAGEPVSPRSDVYSFGVILVTLLTGRAPSEAATPLETARPDVPPALVAVAVAALAEDPQSRPADGAALRALLGDEPVPPAPLDEDRTEILPPPHRAPRRRVSPLLAALVLLALLTAGVAAALLATDEDSGSAPPASSRRAATSPTTAEPDTATVAPPPPTTRATTAGTTDTTPTTVPAPTPAPPPAPTAPTATVPVVPPPTEAEPEPPPPTTEPTTEPTTPGTTTVDTTVTTTAP